MFHLAELIQKSFALVVAGQLVAAPTIASEIITPGTRGGQNVRPTFGGAHFGYESRLGQQIEYLKVALAHQIQGWGFTLVENSISIDSRFDRNGGLFYHYEYDSKLRPVFNSYIPRTVRFMALDNSGEINAGSIYLIEELLGESQEPLNRNSTSFVFRILTQNKSGVFSLSENPDPEFFNLELRRPSFDFSKNLKQLKTEAFESQKLDFVKEKLKSILAPYNLVLTPNSVDIAYYSDFKFDFNFSDRKGYLISYLTETPDSNGHRQIRPTSILWESSPTHMPVSYPLNTSVQTVIQPYTKRQSTVWIADGYTNEDMALEFRMHKPQSVTPRTSIGPDCEQDLAR